MSEPQVWDLYAVKYATLPGRTRHDNFLNADPHDTAPMPMDYYVWVAVSNGRAIVIDTGFEEKEAKRRGRQLLRSVTESLAVAGVEAAKVEDVILTHLHYDHIGGFEEFPNARFHLQEVEMAFATGPHMCSSFVNRSFTPDHIAGMVHRVFEGRVKFYDGSGQVAPGIHVHFVGGHSMGLQIVHVLTKRGWVVVASDATHYYENMERNVPFTTAFHIGDMVRAYDRLRDLAGGNERLIVPGHDPLVMERYPAPEKSMAGIVARLDVDPK